MNDFLASRTVETYSPDELLVSGTNVRSRKVTLLANEVVTRGAVLGKITASGKYSLSVAAAVNGSEDPDAIAAVDVDATGADADIVVYVGVDVNENKLNFGAGHDAASVRDPLRAKGVWLHSAIPVE